MKKLALVLIIPAISYAGVSPKSVDSIEAYFSYKGCEYAQKGMQPIESFNNLEKSKPYAYYTSGIDPILAKEYVMGFIELGASRANYYKKADISCSDFFVQKLDEISAKYDQLLSKTEKN